MTVIIPATVVILVAMLLVALGVPWLRRMHRAVQERNEGLFRVAGEMGLSFSPEGESELRHHLLYFRQLFGRGASISNMIHGRIGSVDIMIFDNLHTRSSVVLFYLDDLHLPAFTLRPINLHDRLARRRIKFDTHPQFSNRFVLNGEDEDAVRTFFNAKVLSQLESMPDISIEGIGPKLIYFRRGYHVSPDEVQSFSKEGFKVLELLR